VCAASTYQPKHSISESETRESDMYLALVSRVLAALFFIPNE